MKAPRIIVVWLQWLGIVASLGLAWGTSHATAVTLRQAAVAWADSEASAANAPRQSVTLPHTWDQTTPDAEAAWYSLSFDAPKLSDDGLPALYLERICRTFEVRINGHLLYRSPAAGTSSHECHSPLLLSLPPALLLARGNVLDIKVQGEPLSRVASRARAAGLGPVVVASSNELASREWLQHTIGREVAAALAAMSALVGLAALAMAWASGVRYLVFFGLTALGWAALSTLACGVPLPLSTPLHEALLTAAMPPVAVAGMVFLLRYCGLALPWLETALWLQCLVVPVTLGIAMPERIHMVALPWLVILLLEWGATLVAFLVRAWRLSLPDFRLMAAALGVALLGLAFEMLLAEPGSLVLPGKLGLSLAMPTLFAGMCWRLYERQQTDLRTAVEARANLEKRLQDVTADMERNYGQMAEMRVEQVAAKERKRIAADLHDDLGAKLLTIVHTSDNDRIATLGREALEEMRLSVRGLTGKPVQLGDAVGDWRSEAMSRLSQGGIELAWNVADEVLFSDRKLSARAYVQTTRILREAISNLLKHSQATQCEITVRSEVNDFEMIIADNGRGIPMELDGKLDRGHGMMTMKSRAKQLQGQCLVESGPGYGTTIRLTLPL